MSLRIIEPGLMTTVQDHGRFGWRHLGVPCSGYADPLSATIANHLVENNLADPCLEMNMIGGTFEFQQQTSFSLAGGNVQCFLNEKLISLYETHTAHVGDVLRVGAIEVGIRCYLAIAGGFLVEKIFASASTTLSAGFGGHHGRALLAGDELKFQAPKVVNQHICPIQYRPMINSGHIMRVTKGPDYELLSEESQDHIRNNAFQASTRADRMGVELLENSLEVSTCSLNSTAVFPGTVQCPPEGNPFLLMVDSQTTGGYPHILQVIRADLHLMGQIKPHDNIRFLVVTPEKAQNILAQKTFLYEQYLPKAPF